MQKAKADAEEIVNQAKAEAAQIVADAQKSADEMKRKTEADIRMAGTQSVAAIRHEVETMIVAQAVEPAVKQALADTDFASQLLMAIVKAFNPADAVPADLDVILPESVKAAAEKFLKSETARQLNANLTVEYSKKLNAGFKISPKDGGYMLQFTDEEFTRLISSYLRPAAKKLLFG